MSAQSRTWTASEVRHGYDQVIRDQNSNPICTVLLAGWDKNSAADHARLIAAAPELLAALEAFLGSFGDFEKWPQGKGYSLSDESLRVFDRARAAIAHATKQED